MATASTYPTIVDTAASLSDRTDADTVTKDWANALQNIIKELERRAGDNTYGQGISGGWVSQQPTPNLTVLVSAVAAAYFGATKVTKTASAPYTVTISAADATNPRIDLITLDSSGTLAVVAGTPAGTPAVPAYPADKMVLAEIYVRATSTAIYNFDQGGTSSYIRNQVQPRLILPYPASGSITTAMIAGGSITSALIADGTIVNADLAGGITNAKLAADVARANLLTNGGFEVWQRGAGAFTANNAYTADRWFILLGASSSLSVTKAGAGLADTTADTGSQFCAKLAYTHSNISNLAQRVEDIYQLRGRTITFSIRVKTSAASAIRVWLNDGVTTAFSGYHTGGGAWETLTYTLAVGASASYLDVVVRLEASATIYLDNAMLVVGSVAADYAPLHSAQEMERCERYFESLGGDDASGFDFAGAGYATSTTTALIQISFKTKKAVVPTLTRSAAGDWAVLDTAPSRRACTALTFGNPGLNTAVASITIGAANLVAGNGTLLTANGTTNARIYAEANP